MSSTADFRLWLVRHPRPLVKPGLCYGITDLPAEHEDTQRCAVRLADALPNGACMSVSGLERAQSLATALHSLRPDLAKPVVDVRINEMDFGQWEMCAWNEINPQAYDAWIKDFGHHRFGGRESVSELLARVDDALKSCMQVSQSMGHPTPFVWITHAGVIRAVQYLQKHRGQEPRADQWPSENMAYGSWKLVNFGP